MTYVGNTSFNIDKRWKEHCHDARRSRCANRPLYADIRKFGTNNFKIDVIEECEESIAPSREMYWIKTLDTFRHGYNLTFGGKGKPFVDYNKIIETYHKERSIKKTAKKIGVSTDTVSTILHENKETIPDRHEITKIHGQAKRVALLHSDMTIWMMFDTSLDAAKWIMHSDPKLKSITSVKINITVACKKNGGKAYNHFWTYADYLGV